VVNDFYIRKYNRPVTRFVQPVKQVAVFVIHEVRLLEPAGIEKSLPPYEDVGAGEVTCRLRRIKGPGLCDGKMPVVVAAVQPPESDVAECLKQGWKIAERGIGFPGGPDQQASTGDNIGFSGFKKFIKPMDAVVNQEGIGVEEEEIFSSSSFCSDIVCGAEAKVILVFYSTKVHKLHTKVHKGGIGGGVVHYNDLEINVLGVGIDGLNALLEAVTGIVIDDDYRDVWRHGLLMSSRRCRSRKRKIRMKK